MRPISLMWVDIEDPGASPDQQANANFIKSGFDACIGRIFSGCYSNEGALNRIVGPYLDLTGYPYFRASDDGIYDLNDVPTNGMHVSYEQVELDKTVEGHVLDWCCRRAADGSIEYGFDISNYTGVPDAEWFRRRWDVDGARFVIFGDQMPYITAQQMARAAESDRDWDPQLYTYINMPGGEYYSNLSAFTQVTRALDALGVPAAAVQDVPAPTPWLDVVDDFNRGDGRLLIEQKVIPTLQELHRYLGGDGKVER